MFLNERNKGASFEYCLNKKYNHKNMDRVHGPPIFTTPKITEVNKNKIKSKVNYN